MKHRAATKERNHLSTDEQTMLLRVGLNLRLKNESFRSIKAALGEVELDNAFV
jgi:hypothetical protein